MRAESAPHNLGLHGSGASPASPSPGALFPAPRPARPRSTEPVCTLVIDAEEDFDWQRPVQGTRYSTTNLRHLSVLHDILDSWNVIPAYLLTYPMLQDEECVRQLRRQLERGRCVLGVQLHTWVTPPFEQDAARHLSYSGNLSPELEERKLLSLGAAFVERFGFAPTIFRGGRYGFGANTAFLLEKHGFAVDTSVAPRTDFRAEGGPDYRGFEYGPFWFGRRRDLLELPLCRSVVGWGGGAGTAAYRALSARWTARLPMRALLTRSHCAERITLSPEGNDVSAMRRLASGLQARGQFLLALSFHSSSLAIGGNPYVRSRADLHTFYDRLSGILHHLSTRTGCRFTDLLHVTDHLLRPEQAAP